MKFEKIHGTGNDFIVTEDRKAFKLTPKQIAKICDRYIGVGADGIIVLKKLSGKRWKWVLFNSDGSRAEMSGNGMRCTALYVLRKKIKIPVIEFSTPAGLKTVEVIKSDEYKGLFRENMGRAFPISMKQFTKKDAKGRIFYRFYVSFLGKKRTASFVSVGNPHCVVIVDKPVFDIHMDEITKFLRNNLHLFPDGVNFEMINIKNNMKIIQRTWERGCGETLSCGTGACAVFLSSYMMGFVKKGCDIVVKGGTLNLSINDDDEIILTGPAEYVFSGEF
ncbi:MAG: diaminopimelate epimerase [Planctomycetes bacterium]|nr:diaminopimelate epimerase [Planctomycetota bacterium]